jgi:hypothetical protein
MAAVSPSGLRHLPLAALPIVYREMNAGQARAMFDVGYFPPNTPPDE